MKKKGKKALWIIIPVLLVVLIAVGFIFFKNEILRFFKVDVISKDAGIITSIKVSTGSDTALENDFIYIIADNGLSVYKSNGEFLRSYIMTYTDMRFAYSDNYLVVYDAGTTLYTLFRQGKKLDEFNAPEDINHIFAYPDYMIMLCEGPKGYTGAVYCVSVHGSIVEQNDYKNEIRYSQKYPVYAAMYDKQDKFVIACIMPDDTDKTYFELFNVGKSTPYAAVSIDEFVPKIACVGTDVFFCAGHQSIVHVGKTMTYEKTVEQLVPELVQSNVDGLFVYGTYNDKNILLRIDADGKIVWEKQIESSLKGFTIYGNKLVTWHGFVVDMYKTDSGYFHKIETESQIRQVLIMQNNKMLIITSDNVILYRY